MILQRVDDYTNYKVEFSIDIPVKCEECKACDYSQLYFEPDPDYNFDQLPSEPVEVMMGDKLMAYSLPSYSLGS